MHCDILFSEINMSHLFKTLASLRKVSEGCGPEKLYNVLCYQVMSQSRATRASPAEEVDEKTFVSLSWTRPKNVPFPNVWAKFEMKSEQGQILKLQVEDVSPDRYEEFLDFQYMNFDCREPISKSIDLISDLQSVAARRSIRSKILEQKISIMITLQEDRYNDGKPKIIGARNSLVVTKDDPPIRVAGKKLTSIMDLYSYLQKDVNPYQFLNSNSYISDFGASMASEYSALGIGLFLLTPTPLMSRLWNIPGATNIFTSTPSQRIAQKAGFKMCKEVAYKDYKDKCGKPVFPLKGNCQFGIVKFD